MAEEKTYREVGDEGKNIYSNILSMKDLQIMKWQRMTFMSSIITAISVAGLIFVSTRSTFIPYVISVDEKTGYVTSLGSLKEVNHDVTPAEVNYFLSRFIENVREIPLDTSVLQKNIKRATNYLSPESATKFKNLYLDEFTKKIGTGINRINILSVNPIANMKDMYQVRWNEVFIPVGGTTSITKTYTGTFNMVQERLDDKELLVSNPLGLIIKDFSISEEGVGNENKK